MAEKADDVHLPVEQRVEAPANLLADFDRILVPEQLDTTGDGKVDTGARWGGQRVQQNRKNEGKGERCRPSIDRAPSARSIAHLEPSIDRSRTLNQPSP